MRKESSSNYLNKEKVNAYCGTAYALSVIGGRWKSNILCQLSVNGKMRYGELRKMIPDVSERMLVAQLKELESDQLVHRIVYPEVPPRVEYELTPLGNSIRPMLRDISDWGNMHRDLVKR